MRLVTATLLLAAAEVVAAQQPEARMIRGTVTDSTGRRLAWVNVQTSGQGRTITNDSGQFSYKAQAKGDVELRVFRIGYEPRMIKLNPAADTSINVSLKVIARSLEAVEVEANRINKRLQAHGFYQRMEDRQKGIGSGTFFTREDIEQRNPVRITQMLDGLKGLRLVRTMIPTPRANQTRSPSNSTKGASPGSAQMPRNSMDDWVIQGPGDCNYTVYLDGTMFSPRRDAATRETVGMAIDPYLSPGATAAIEIYQRGPGVPTQYAVMGETCGVVVFWSR